MNRLHKKTPAILWAFVLASCTSQNLDLPIPGKRSSDATSATSIQTGEPQYDKDGVVTNGTQTTVDPPVQTAGAFLVCRADVEPMPDPTMAMGGCKLVREDVKYDGWRSEFVTNTSVIPEKEGQSFAPEVLAAMNIESVSDDFDAWHWRVVYPRSAPLMLFQLELSPVTGGAIETVRAFLKGQEWTPLTDQETELKWTAALTGEVAKGNVVTVRANVKDKYFYMVPASFKATLKLGTTQGLIVTFSGKRPTPFGPCRFEAVGQTEVTGDGVVPTAPSGLPKTNRSLPDPSTVYFEMMDNCKDAKAGQIRLMKEVEFTVERPKDQTPATELSFDVILPALEQKTADSSIQEN